jgi:hypothetical protein
MSFMVLRRNNNNNIITLQQTLAQWRIAFLLCSSILVIDAIVFLLFGSTERQPWDKEETN